MGGRGNASELKLSIAPCSACTPFKQVTCFPVHITALWCNATPWLVCACWSSTHSLSVSTMRSCAPAARLRRPAVLRFSTACLCNMCPCRRCAFIMPAHSAQELRVRIQAASRAANMPFYMLPELSNVELQLLLHLCQGGCCAVCPGSGAAAELGQRGLRLRHIVQQLSAALRQRCRDARCHVLQQLPAPRLWHRLPVLCALHRLQAKLGPERALGHAGDVGTAAESGRCAMELVAVRGCWPT